MIELKTIIKFQVDPQLEDTIFEMIQTRDVFHIGFQPDDGEYDINVYLFKNFNDIFKEVKAELNELPLDEKTKIDILFNLIKYSKDIDENIKLLGVPHVFD